jgi:hypothetical protein
LRLQSPSVLPLLSAHFQHSKSVNLVARTSESLIFGGCWAGNFTVSTLWAHYWRFCKDVNGTSYQKHFCKLTFFYESNFVLIHRIRKLCKHNLINIQLLYGFRVWMAWFGHAGMLRELRKARETRAEGEWFCALFLTRATFSSVWIRPSKHGNHKVIVL